MPPPGDRSYQSYGGAPQQGGYGGAPHGGYGGAPQGGHGGPQGAGQRYNEKPSGGSGRVVQLQVEKVADKTLQSRLIYGNT